MVRGFNKLTLTLQNRLILTTIVPLLGLTIVLTATTMVDRHQDITARLQESGRSITTYLASVSDFALYSADKQLLNSLVAATSRLEGVSGVAFLNTRREIVVSTFSGPDGTSNLSEAAAGEALKPPEDYLYFEQQVLTVNLNTEDYEPAEGVGKSQAVGWVIVALDPAANLAQRRTMLINGIGLASAIMTVAIVLSYLLSRNIIRPLQKLTDVVNRIEAGDYSIRAQSAPSHEFNVLAHGINHMVESIEENQAQLQREVSSASVQVQETLADLRSKNRELEIAMQKADDANTAKTDFLARMSHELRTPLTSIQGFISLLESADLGSTERQYCKIIDQASQLLLQLIDDILEFTRLQAHATGLEELPFNFYQCLESPIQLLAPMAHDKRIELILDMEPDVPVNLIADSRRIRQIISNLVSNSIKFTETGFVLVRVYLLVDEPDQCRVAIAVRDTGIGISDEQKKYIFDAFTQADISISRRFGGAGLGLSIVNGLTNLMGGNISVRSTEGEGSQITAVLPLKKQHASLTTKETPRKKLGLHLALYDPDPVSRQAMEHLLTRVTASFESYTDIGELRIGLTSTQASLVLVNGASVAPANPRAYPYLLSYIRECTELPLIITLPLKQIQNRVAAGQDDSLQPASFVGKPLSIDNLYSVLASRDRTQTANEATTKSLSGINALVAEDNEFSQLLIKTLLDRAGCQYRLVDNGRKAIEASTREQFDILIIDGHMPELDGWKTLKQIRALSNINHATPAIFLTADVLVQQTQLSASVGIDHIMHKPFDEAVLIDAMSKLTSRLADNDQGADLEASPIWQRIPKEKFFSEMETLLDAAEQANRAQQASQLGEVVHQLLGIAGVFKMSALAQLASVLQGVSRTGDAKQIDDAIGDLTSELNKLKQEAV